MQYITHPLPVQRLLPMPVWTLPAVLSHAMLSLKIQGDQRIQRTIADNTYRLLQEHIEGHRLREALLRIKNAQIVFFRHQSQS